MKLTNQVVIVTGASRGIGPAIAEALAAEGAKVVLSARKEAELQKVAAQIEAKGGKALVVPCDVSQEEQVLQLFAKTKEAFGRVDILVNNAGVGVFGPFHESTTEQWDWVMEITLKGAYLCAREAVKAMLEQGEGLIINIGSDLSYKTSANCSVYGAAKYAVGALTQTINKEYRTKGIRCTGIYPGMIDTYFAGSEMGADYKADWLKAQDLAEAVRYVATQPKHVRIDEIRMHPMIQDDF
jgi:NADP-dependent 3-hydroxy acid dehydrogenase YdfG